MVQNNFKKPTTLPSVTEMSKKPVEKKSEDVASVSSKYEVVTPSPLSHYDDNSSCFDNENTIGHTHSKETRKRATVNDHENYVITTVAESNEEFPDLYDSDLSDEIENESDFEADSLNHEATMNDAAEQIIVDSVVDTVEGEETRETMNAGACNYCINCNRSGVHFDVLEYNIVLSDINIGDVNGRSSWRTFKMVDIRNSGRTSICLCNECCGHLLLDSNKRGKKQWRDIWPVYIWLLITDDNLLSRYGADVLKFIPVEWHAYWKYRLCKTRPDIFDINQIDQYKSATVVTKDVSYDKREFIRITSDLRLGELKHGCNKYLFPKVLCPWGCTSYLHHEGEIEMDALYGCLFPYIPTTGRIASMNKVKCAQSMRRDFFSDLIDMHLFNPEWSVHPSVFYKAGFGPVFTTCKEHCGGTKKLYFHLPKTGSSLPSKFPDMLSHAVLRSRTLKPMKAHKYTNTYQLNKCTGSFSGIDTCFISSKRQFDFKSHLLDLSEARSYQHRADIKGLTGRLVRMGTIPETYADNLKVRATELYSEPDARLTKGATMMTLTDAINLQKMVSTPPLLDIRDSNGKIRSIRKNWPSHLVQIHANDEFGSCFPTIMDIRENGKNDTKITWILLYALVCVPLLWAHVCDSVVDSEQWHGFVLSYLARKVLQQSTSSKYDSNPFFVKEHDKRSKPEGLTELIKICCSKSNDRDISKMSPKCFEQIFSNEKNRDALRVAPLPPFLSADSVINACKCISDNCNILIFHKGTNKIDAKSSLPENLHVPEFGQFELRFVATSSNAIRRKRVEAKTKGVVHTKKRTRIDGDDNVAFTDYATWDGIIFARHGGPIFKGWWAIDYSGKTYGSKRPIQLQRIQGTNWEDLQVAIYVKLRPVSLEIFRREYLSYIGGQSAVFCSKHDIPLITSMPKNDLNCCMDGTEGQSSCNRKSAYSCAVEDCCSCICSSCFKKCSANNTRVNVCCDSTGADEQIVQRFADDDENNSCESTSSVDSYASSSSDSEDSNRYSVCDDDSISLESTGSSVEEGYYAFDHNLSGHTGDNVAFDLEHCPETDNDEFEVEDDGAYRPIIPTTRTGAYEGIATESECKDDSCDYNIGSSVMLNKCGSMLVRRNTQLQASRRERNLIERIVSYQDVGTVPLVYLEGVLFPSIFYSLPHASDGGVLGAMPISFFCQHQTRQQFNVASVAEHAKVRLTSIGNSASTCPKYCSFTFDAMANGALPGNDTRVVLSRGFEESMGPAGMRMRNKDDDFYTDSIDNRQNVHNLCASEREAPSTLFITLTCNQRDHFGVSPVKRYIDDGQALVNYQRYYKTHFPNEKPLSSKFLKEVQDSLVEACKTLIVRNWLEVKTLLLAYMLKSPEKPFGVDVLKIFNRDEYQADVGNLCHMHMLVTLPLSYDNAEDKIKIQKLIRGSVDDIVSFDEVDGYIKEGLLDDWEDYELMKEQASKFLKHVHDSRCKMRTGSGDKELKCRRPDPILMSGDITSFYEATLNAFHSKPACDIMERIGLCEPMMSTNGVFKGKESFLIPKRILPPARRDEGNISPVIGRLFVATRSSMNVQICTSHGTSRYIVKYLIKIDENNYIAFSVNQRDPTDIKSEKVFLHNTKVATSKINEDKRLRESRHWNKPKGRAISSPEQIQILLGYPQVYSTAEFIRVPTVPLGERSGCERVCPADRYKQQQLSSKGRTIFSDHDAFSFMVPTVGVRNKLFKKQRHRLHTPSQIVLLEDQMKCKLSLDRVTIFGLRPPELLIINKLEWYFRFFVRSSEVIEKDELREALSINETKSIWVDGLGRQVTLRPKAIPELYDILTEARFKRLFEHKYKCSYNTLFRICTLHKEAGGLTIGNNAVTKSKLTRSCKIKEWEDLQTNLVETELAHRELPIPVFSNVKPHNACKFMIHVLLSMGHFETERDIWQCTSFKEAFQYCNLLENQEGKSDIKAEIDCLLKKWILDQLRFYPIGNKAMDEYIVKASHILSSAIAHNEIPIDDIPPYLYTSLVKDISEKTIEHKKTCKEVLVDATIRSLKPIYGDALHSVVPTKEELIGASKHKPIQWNAVFPKTSRQSNESYEEQCQIQHQCSRAIDYYTSCDKFAAKNFLLAGPPGAGKTHCMAHSIVYSLCLGLSCMTTAVLADRAFLLGGQHFHKLFKLKVRNQGKPHRLAELAVISLQKQVEFLGLLRTLDILFVDEIGQLSAELLSTLDIILRRIRCSSIFMGGILVIATIDQVQLRPIKGLPFLLSPYVLTCFSMGILKHYVRCSTCWVLKELNRIARMFTHDQAEWDKELQKFAKLIAKYCTFVESWDNPIITDEVLRVLPKKDQVMDATLHFLEQKEKCIAGKGGKYYKCMAADTMLAMESHGDWIKANKNISKMLDHDSKEPAVLHFFEGAVYEFTCNVPGRFMTTQIGVILDMPDEDTIKKFGDIKIWVAPAGTKVATVFGKSKQELMTEGWKETKVGVNQQYSFNYWRQGVKAKRQQYTIKTHVASTVHSAIGHTVPKIATNIAEGGLWERAMVVVLISRVTQARDLVFVGNKKRNIAALLRGLRVRNQYDDYMNHIVETLTASTSGSARPTALEFRHHPFRPKDIPLPIDSSGVVYMLVSAKDANAMYIGYTQDMTTRLSNHNSGIGSKESSDPTKRPYILYAYVAGFVYNRNHMNLFEKKWQALVQHRRPSHPDVAVEYARELIGGDFSSDNLVLIISGE